MKYFAYSEKMFSHHLNHIVREVICLGVVKAIGYKLFFHNRGIDDFSGKCNIVPVNDLSQEVYGVLYEIKEEERYLLDRSEGLGISTQEIILKVYPVNTQEEGVFAFTYVAHKDNVFEDLVPFSWYKEMVISGAKEHQLPENYIHHLEQYACSEDPNVQRANKQKRVLGSVLL